MIIIGERINATRKTIASAIEKKDKEFIKKEVSLQIKYGANFLDLNAGLGKGREKEDLLWLVNTVQEIDIYPLSLDSSDPEVLDFCLPAVKSSEKMINSINGEEKKIKNILPIIKKYSASKIVLLTMDDNGIPATAEKRVEIAEKMINLLLENNVKIENIFVDCLVQPISVDIKNGIIFLSALKKLKTKFPEVKTTCGLSNVSFGLPKRKIINKYFLALAIYEGLDSAIVDPSNEGICEAISSSEVLAGKDEFCLNYIKMCRQIFG